MKIWILRLLTTRNEIAPLILRLTLGAVILPHGLQKTLGLFGGYGFGGTMGYFTGTLHIPAFFAFLAILAESAGALGLLLGLYTRVAAFGIGVTIGVAALMAHVGNGFFMNWSGKQAGEGFEYHLLVVGLALALMIIGGGRASADAFLARKLSIAS